MTCDRVEGVFVFEQSVAQRCDNNLKIIFIKIELKYKQAQKKWKEW